jgi:hypothetical protein
MGPDFEALLARLVGGGVELVLVGGYSAMLHGSSLMTRDVDIVCPMTPQNLGRLFDALRGLNPVHRMNPSASSFTPEQAARTDWKNLYLHTDIGVLDCLGEVRGIGDYQACLERSTSLDLGEFTIKTLSLEALIEAKRAMGRPRDLLTAEELEMILARRKRSQQ